MTTILNLISCCCIKRIPAKAKSFSIRVRIMSTFTVSAPANPFNIGLQQTMLRIKDPKKSVPYYVDIYGFTLIHSYDFPQWNFSLYFLAILPEGETPPAPGTTEAEAYLWNLKYSCLELTHNHGSETDESFKVNNGNVEPHRGFGHIAVMTRDVYGVCAELEAAGVRFQKKPNEGRMKGLAFALDPDGYWVEIITRSSSSSVGNKYTLAQTMQRIKDPSKSIPFYTNVMKMTLLQEMHFGPSSGDFSLYFLASIPPGTPIPEPNSPDAGNFIRDMFPQVLELTHNHGTESQPDFKYHNGNDLEGGRGFGHTGFLVDDLDAVCTEMTTGGVPFKKRPEEGAMRGLAFIYDPDNYSIELIQRGVSFPPVV
jgi:lactoylglutathione lyase